MTPPPQRRMLSLNRAFMTIQCQNASKFYEWIFNTTPKRPYNVFLCRTNFSPDPIQFHRVPLSWITVSPSPILLNHVLLCQRDRINEFLNPLQYDSITYSFVNEIRRNNFSLGPIRLHRVPFSTSPIQLHRVPFTAGTVPPFHSQFFTEISTNCTPSFAPKMQLYAWSSHQLLF